MPTTKHRRKKPIRRNRKTCPQCRQNKPLSAFYNPRRTYCSECERREARERYHTSLKSNLTDRFRSRISRTLPPGTKIGKIFEGVLPYSFEVLVLHLRTRVPEGFTWEDLFNGNLQIDHVRPIASFDFSDPHDREFKRCWSLGNITLLPSEHNARKGSRFNGITYRRDG